MKKEEMEGAIRSTAEALFALAEAVKMSAERNFAMRAELEAVRVISQAFMATLRCEPAFAAQLQKRLEAAVEADRIVLMNTPIEEELLRAREVWMKALVPPEIHEQIFHS
ncbi:MAG: hypothetical protein EOO38_10595 [Cytophagaceae bacterium]|nr:MAG: hypothetical protein EOO38_10595 [Cytophagaceae bacterium]